MGKAGRQDWIKVGTGSPCEAGGYKRKSEIAGDNRKRKNTKSNCLNKSGSTDQVREQNYIIVQQLFCFLACP